MQKTRARQPAHDLNHRPCITASIFPRTLSWADAEKAKKASAACGQATTTTHAFSLHGHCIDSLVSRAFRIVFYLFKIQGEPPVCFVLRGEEDWSCPTQHPTALLHVTVEKRQTILHTCNINVRLASDFSLSRSIHRQNTILLYSCMCAKRTFHVRQSDWFWARRAIAHKSSLIQFSCPTFIGT